MFPPKPGPGDAFLVAFEKDHSNHILALVLSCERAGGAGIDPKNPPIQWQGWQGGAARWVPCEVGIDGTGGLYEAGGGTFVRPALSQGKFSGANAYWLSLPMNRTPGGTACRQ